MSVNWDIVRVWTSDTPNPNRITKVEYRASLEGFEYGGTVDLLPAPEPFVSAENDEPVGAPPFIPYESLTKSQVLDWLWQRVSKATVEAVLNEKVDEKQPELPWVVADAS